MNNRREITGRDLIPSELLHELVESITLAKGQLTSLATFEEWLRRRKDTCISPKSIQNWIEEYRKNITAMKAMLTDGMRAIKTANEGVPSPIKSFEQALLTERVVSRFQSQK